MTRFASLRPLLVAAALVAGTPACAIGDRMLAPAGEYDAYRATRTAHTVEDRLTAARRYLAEHPRGRFAAEVRARFEQEEQAFYDAKSTSILGLEWYLHVLPDGPHAPSASLRLADLEAEAKRRHEDALVAAGRTQEKRLAAAAASRKAAVDTMVTWVSAIPTVTSWGSPTWALPSELLLALRGEPNPGKCGETTCTRVVTIPFQVPVAGGGLEDRAVTMDLVIRRENGGVREIAVRGPELFSRLFEASRGQPLDPDKERARAEAVTYALEVVSGAFEGTAPATRCDRNITPPEILRRECDGWTIRVVIGDTPADDDVVSVRGPR